MRTIAVTGGILAAVSALVPRFLFPVCSGPHGAMRCTQTGHIVELVMIVALIGWLTPAIATKRLQARVAPTSALVAAAGAVASLLAVLAWPGVCTLPAMPCVIGTRPAVVMLSGLQLVSALVLFLLARRARRSA